MAKKTCNGVTTPITQQVDYDLRNKLTVTPSQVPPGCSYTIEVHGYDVPANGLVVYESWFWHNEVDP